MRITQLMLSKGFGGGERYFADLVVALAEAGHEVQAVCHERYPHLEGFEASPRARIDTINARGMWDRSALRRLDRYLGEFRPTVVHTHMARAAWAASKVRPAAAWRLVATTHNYVNLKYYRGVDVFIPTTADQARHLSMHGVDAERVVRIPNFSNLPADPDLGGDWAGARFVSVGRFVEKKGFSVLLRALHRARFQGYDVSLLLGGDGPGRRTLVREVAALGLGEWVKLAGWVSDVAAFLRRGDIFVLPSLDEPFGIVMLEAMACGRPIVTSRTQGPSEVLDDRTAFFAEVGDADSLAAAMVEAVTNSDVAGRKARAASVLYRSTYSRDAVVPQIIALYERMGSAPQEPPTTPARGNN